MKNDQKDGKGKLKYQNNDEYIGNFKNDNLDGYGIMTYQNGNIY